MRSALAVVALGAALAAAASGSGAFSVGVLRRDGVLIPFATYDGRNWSARWPAPALELEVPVTVSSVPSRWWGPTGPLDTWQAAVAAGEPRTVRVVQPDWVAAHCVRQIGLRTDYQSDALRPPPNEQPYPKDGLAVAPPRSVEHIRKLPVDGEDAAALGDALLGAFNEAERKTANRFTHPVKAAVRDKVAPTVEAIYAHGSEPRAYYVEAVREYAATDTGQCVLVAFGTGWFVREVGRARPLTMAVDALECDRMGASYMLPLGVIRDGTRLFWFVQFSGFDHERYVVVEPRATRVDALVSAWGGGCR